MNLWFNVLCCLLDVVCFFIDMMHCCRVPSRDVSLIAKVTIKKVDVNVWQKWHQRVSIHSIRCVVFNCFCFCFFRFFCHNFLFFVLLFQNYFVCFENLNFSKTIQRFFCGNVDIFSVLILVLFVVTMFFREIFFFFVLIWTLREWS